MDDIEEINANLIKVQAAIDLLADTIEQAEGNLDKPLLEEIVGEMMVGQNAKLDRLTSKRITDNENAAISDYMSRVS